MKTITSKIRGLVSILLVVCIFASLPLTTFATEGKAAYIITYHVGAYDVFTDVEGNMSVTIDGVKYYYSDDYGRYDDISDNFHSMKNTNVLYELQNNEIVRVYSLDNVLVPSVKAEPSVKEGLFYKNGKFSQSNFDLTIKVTNQLNNTFQGKNLLNYLSTTEKNRLYTTLKKLEIEPSGQVDFGSSGWWLWKDYKTNIAENYNDDIKVNETKEYRYTVNLRNNKALNQSEYNIEFYTKPTFDFGTLNRITSKVKVGNLDYQEEKTETKKAKSNAGKTASEATTKLEGLKTAIQFSNNILTSEQQKEVNEEVNLWISQLILARNVDKSDLSGKISQDISKKWLSKLGVDSGVLLSPGVIKATHYLKTKTSGGTEIFIEFNINITSFTFGNSSLPTMASGSGSATIYNMNGQKLDSSTILPAYADVCAFCKQLQAVAKSSILDITKQYRSIFGVDSDATAEALSSEIMGKILNSKYTKNVFKRISARDVKAVLKKIISDGDKKCTDKIFELLTTPSKNSTLVSVKCPVDVTVYDNDGKICGMVKNNVVDTSYNDVFINVVGDQKNIYLIGDDYTFTMTGTDSGKMDYVVKEFDEQGNTTSNISYENIKLTKDCKYYSYVPEAINHDSVLFNLTDNNSNVISDTTSINFDEVEESGKCGQDVYWAMNNDGTLYIYGNGDMWSYLRYGPWGESKKIKNIVIANGVTSIGWRAFRGCSNVENIIIPGSVSYIGYAAFACTLSGNVIIKNVHYRGTKKQWDNIYIEQRDSGNSELDYAIKYYMYYDYEYTIYTKGKGSIYAYASRITMYTGKEQEVKIPSTIEGYRVDSIGENVFLNNKNMTHVIISNSITIIGDNAFRNCDSLRSVVYNGSLKDWNNINFGINNDCLKSAYNNSNATSIYLNKTNISIDIGKTETLYTTILPSGISNETISWESSDTDVATVENGFITAIGVGTAKITAKTLNGLSATCLVKVNPMKIPETTVTPETTIEPTTAPATVPSSVFTVCATSNIFPQTKAEYNSSTKRVTVTYYLGTARDIVNLEWYLTFDNTVLDYNKSNNYDVSANKLNIMPQITPFGGDVIDTSFLGKISANASNLSLYSIDSAKPFVRVTFDVIGEPENIETTVNLNVRTLTTAEYGNDTENPDFSIINSFVDNYILNDSAELTFANTVLTDTTNGLIEWKNLSDENTNISVSGVVNSNADLNVSKRENTYEKSVATYDITLQKDGIAIQPDGAITIKIPSDVKDCKVMWLKDDGTAEDMNAEYIDGCYVFTTDHLSVYALVQDKTILKGDANQDGVVNIIDATYLQKHIVGYKNSDDSVLIDETNRQLFDTIDMNKDGKLTIVDATDLQMYILENN